MQQTPRIYPPRSKRWADLFGLGVFVVFFVTLFLLPVPGEDEEIVASSSISEASFAVVGAQVFDGEKTWRKADVWVESGEIKAVGEELSLPEELTKIDGEDQTLLPGLIDAHVHTWGGSRADSARFGVTTLLDQFTSTSVVQEARRDRDEGGAQDRADLFSAGMLATADGGHGTQFGTAVQTLANPEEASEWVTARKEEGSDWIKIVVEPGWRRPLSTLDHETAGAVIRAAHDQGLKAVVHISNLDDALTMARLGADGLVHIWGDRVPNAEEVEVFRQSGLFVIPTLVVMEGMVNVEAAQDLTQTFNDRLSSSQRNSISQRFPAAATMDWNIPIESVRRLAEAGVPILAGSDAPNPTTAMGVSLHREMELLVQAGLSAEQALAAATEIPAKHFGVPQRGKIAVGSLADLVLVNGNPIESVGDSQRFVKVWKRGQPIDLAVKSAGEPIGNVAQAPDETLLADFENGLESRFGQGWMETTDQRLGGKSVVTLRVEEGALVIEGEIKGGAMFPWAGTMVSPGEALLSPVDFSSRKTLQFRARGDGRQYSAMLFSGDMQGIPPSQSFHASESWQKIELPLDGFSGADLSTLRGISFSATQPTGTFKFEIDDVELR